MFCETFLLPLQENNSYFPLFLPPHAQLRFPQADSDKYINSKKQQAATSVWCSIFQAYIRVIVVGPLFFFGLFSVAQSGLDVVVALQRARVAFRGCGACGEPHVRG